MGHMTAAPAESGTTITGSASTIDTETLTAERAIISNGNTPSKIGVSATTSTELGYVSGVTSAIQTQLDAKQATITGSATTIATGNLLANRAVISDGNFPAKIAISPTTSTELGYVNGVTSAIQTQLDAKGPAIQIMKWTKTGSANITNLPHDIASGQKSLIDVGSVNWTEDTAGTTHAAIAISPDYGIQFLQSGIYRIDTGFYFQSTGVTTSGVICAMEATTSTPDPTQTGWLPSSYSINMGYNRLDVYLSAQNLNSDPDFNMVFNINTPTTVYLFGEVANLSGGVNWRIRHHATAPLSQVTVTRIGDVQA